MEATTLKLDKDRAKELLAKYRAHRAGATPVDEAIMRAYREIARGRVVIRAHESIRRAGFDAKGLPRLAIMRADRNECHYSGQHAALNFKRTRYWQRGDVEVACEVPEFARGKSAHSVVPFIPPFARPKSRLHLYSIMWEADWQQVPADPMLLRKLSGDLWLVVAAWDLTEVERAVLADRVNS